MIRFRAIHSIEITSDILLKSSKIRKIPFSELNKKLNFRNSTTLTGENNKKQVGKANTLEDASSG